MASVSGQAEGGRNLGAYLRSGDFALALAVVVVIGMMIVPLPPLMLDLLLVTNLALALMVLMVGLYVRKPLEFSTFPSVLLILTLARLALNISTSRLILLDGNVGGAGQVIEAFGALVVGGNYAVGIVIFVILVVINFVVITNGAGRISEVAARFTLDAMPGKQMAIDADLNAGLIDEQSARARRREIQLESDFYGNMDGASKFVRGDAIAGIIIILVNILGGLAVGVLQQGMGLAEAAARFTLLTVGDGLVSQIPAVIISMGTGILVSKTATEVPLGKEVGTQIFGDPRVLSVAAGLMLVLGLVPGMPKLPFFGMAALVGGLAFYQNRQAQLAEAEASTMSAEGIDGEPLPTGPENVMSLLGVDTMELEIGYRLIPLVDAGQGGDLLERVKMIRRQTALKLGLVVPPIRVRDNLQLKPKEYRVNLRGIEIARGEVLVDHYMAMNAGMAVGELEGTPTKEPVFGLPAVWIPEAKKEEAEIMGFTVFDPSSVVATHLTELIKQHAGDLLTRQDAQTLLDHAKETAPAVVNELVPDLLTVGEVQRVLQNLLRERVSVRDLVPVLEALATHARLSKDPDTLTEYARQGLARAITASHLGPDGSLPVLTLDPGLEQILANSVQQTDQGAFVNLEPGAAQRLLQNLGTQLERHTAAGNSPVLLTSSKVRLVLRRLIERRHPTLAVLAYHEIMPANTEVRALGLVSLG